VVQSLISILKRSKIYNNALYIVKELVSNGYKSYFVGGSVRDGLLGRNIKEIDIVTSAKPDDIKRIFKRTIEVGKAFGVIIVLCADQKFEVATFRKDLEYSDGRRPDKIEFSDEVEDALRRDFTVNGIFFDPINQKLIDYVDGVYDINRKIIRTIGNPYDRFSEDKLRMLRAVRFSAQLDFCIESETINSIKRMSYQISVVSRERIRDEFFKILNLDKPISQYLEVIYDTGMWGVLEIDFDKNNIVFVDKIRLSPVLDNNEISILRLTGLIWNHKHLLKSIKESFRLSNEEYTKMLNIIKLIDIFKDVNKLSLSSIKRVFRMKYIQEALYFLDIWQDFFYPEEKDKKHYLVNKYYETKDFLYPPVLVSGDDLKKIGLQPGPLFSKILRDIEDMQLEGKIKNRDDALNYIKGMIGV